jgi:hypothetical protein
MTSSSSTVWQQASVHCFAEGGQHADSHVNESDVLESLVVRAEGGGIGDCVELHAAESDRNDAEECPGPVCGPKALSAWMKQCDLGSRCTRDGLRPQLLTGGGNHIKGKKTRREPRLTPGGLRPRHPRKGGRREGNAGRHWLRVATREGARSNCAPNQQQTHSHQLARPQQQQKSPTKRA